MSLFKIFGNKYDQAWKIYKLYNKLIKKFKEGKMSVLPDKPLGSSMTVWGALLVSIGALLTGIGTQMVDGSVDVGGLIKVIMQYGGPVATALGALFAGIGIRRKLGQ